MSIKTLTIPEDSLINMLKTLPEKHLVDLFWRTLVMFDTSPLTKAEKKAVKQAKEEFARRETIRWESIK